MGRLCGVLAALAAVVFAGSLGPSADAADAATWTMQAAPPPLLRNGSLRGVSCTASSACTAVGSYVDSAGVGVALAERWDGASWSIQPTASIARGGLSGVACTSATDCVAVG